MVGCVGLELLWLSFARLPWPSLPAAWSVVVFAHSATVIATRSRPASFMVGVSVAARSLSAATAGVALDINYSTISIMTQLPDADPQTMAASVGTGFSWDTCPTSCR